MVDLYQKTVKKIADLSYDWSRFTDKTIVISGATGMIGTFMIDVLMYLNTEHRLNLTIYALGRSETKAQKRFVNHWGHQNFHFLVHDITQPFHHNLERVDYILHLASTTHPLDYARIPIETVTSNILGTQYLLELASQYRSCRFMLASTVEVYGENRGDVDKFDEHYCGYIDSNTLRAGYPESKRAAEALCQAYRAQKDVDVVIARLSRVYGPTLLADDSKALSQFIKKAVHSEDIVLKSEGNQYFSYAYVADAVSALLYLFLLGENGEAYNIATDDIRLKDLAQHLADIAGTKVIFDLPSEAERAGYSTATKALLDTQKIEQLGWKAGFDLEEGLSQTVEMMKEPRF